MDHNNLSRYAHLYRASRYYQADRTLREYIGVGANYVVPLGLPHGADFGHSVHPSDILTIEPIYWACNAALQAAAVAIKPSVAIPHPLLLTEVASRTFSPEKGTLVIGPPPGPHNDRVLHAVLEERGITSGDVLVKRRVGWEKSREFWQSRGFKPVTFSEASSFTYNDMGVTLSKYDTVASGTVSSAVVFAAALGSAVTLMPEYAYTAYESTSIEDSIAKDVTIPRAFVMALAHGSREVASDAARQMLGSNLPFSPSSIRSRLDEAIASIREPVFFAKAYPWVLKKVLLAAATRLNRPGLIRMGLGDRLKSIHKRVGILTSRDVDIWLNDRTSANFLFREVKYVPGVTIPGRAVDRY